MPVKKSRYSIEQHDQLGKELQAMRNRMQTISIELSKAYPFSTKAPDLATLAVKAIDEIRNKMANLAIQEHGGQGDSIYFRGGREK